jgi:hypothetical protein
MVDTEELIRAGADGTIRGVQIDDAKRDPDCPRLIEIGGVDYVGSAAWFGFIMNKSLLAQPGEEAVTFLTLPRRQDTTNP